jgi:glucose/arabinose dehydrogenase
MMRLLLALLLLPCPALALDLTETTEHGKIRIETFAEGLVRPWGLVFLPEGGMLVTERPGRIRFVSDEGTLSPPLKGVPAVMTGEQCGLLDIALDPDFAANRLVYVIYCEPAADGLNSNAIARGRLADDRSELLDVEVIFSAVPRVTSVQNSGARLLFDADGNLFATLGDKYDHDIRVQAQTLDSHIGKIIRIRPDGSAPADNPFVGVEGALPEIWTLGHRNPQGAAFDPATGDLYAVEHGPFGGDELNRIEPGRNYGWPVISYGADYEGPPVGTGKQTAEGMEDPVHQWTPVIAASGMIFYDGAAFPEWRGDIFVAGLASTALVRVELDGGRVVHEERLLMEAGFRIRHVWEAADGTLFVLTDEEEGQILHVTPAE